MTSGQKGAAGFPRILYIALFLSFLFRLSLALLSASRYVPVGDEGEYLLLADTLLHEGKFGVSPTAYRLPLYPMLLAASQGLTGVKVHAYLVVNAFLGTAAVALIYSLCRRLVNEQAARISLLISAPNPFLMANSGDILTENLFVPLVLAFLLAVVVAEEGDGTRWRRWLMAGVFLGLCNLTRPTLLRFGLLLLVFYLLVERKLGARTRGAILAIAVSITFLLPWWVRNYDVFGKFIPGTTGEGFVWLGCYNEKAFSNPTFKGSWVNYQTDITPAPFFGKNEFDRDRIASAMAREYAFTHIASIPATLPWKLLRAFYWYPLVIDRLYPAGPARRVASRWGFIFSMILVYPLLVWEGCMRVRERPFATPILLCAYFLFVILATYGSTRMRLPIEGVLILFASAGWDRFITKVRSITKPAVG